MSSIDRFGYDSETLIVQDHFAIAYQARWTVPEEVGEQQPLFDPATEQWFVFHGRVDNRQNLLQILALDVSQKISDAALMWRYFQKYGESALSDVIGPYVFVVLDPRTNTINAARDGMGGRYLCYRITDEHVLISTYELAIVEHGSIKFELNDEKVARSLVNEMEAFPSSTIAGITPLKPGEWVHLDSKNERHERFYKADPKARVQFSTDEEYAAEFKRLLHQAVKRRLRCLGPVGSMLSGGLDSVPMTIAAAQQSATKLHAFSWVFDDYPELDERQYSISVCQRFTIQQHMINCDRVWPQFDDDTHFNPIFPFGNPYSEFQQETFRRAQTEGVKCLLSGLDGDLLYESTHGILYELIRAKRGREAWQEFTRLWASTPSKWWLLKTYLLRPLKIVERIGQQKKRRTGVRRANNPYNLLQDQISALLKPARHWLFDESQDALRPKQWQIVFDAFAGEDAAYGRYMDAKYGIERRYPFRDRDLCEFMLAIPSDQLYFNLVKRPIVKRAFSREFTRELNERNSKTNFTPIINDGIEKDIRCQTWFESTPFEWSYYVKECYFDSKTTQKQGLNVIQWRCGYFNYWNSRCAKLTQSEMD